MSCVCACLVHQVPSVPRNAACAVLRLAKAHCTLVLHQNFLDCVSRERGAGRVSEATAGVLRQLASLLCLHHMEGCMGDYLEDGYMTGEHSDAGI